MSTQSAIHVDSLTKKFGEKTAVDNISLDVKHGEIYGFLGPNGAGKSTTIKMLVTLIAPSEGDATILGSSVVQDPTAVRLKIGVALQEAALDKQQTGIEFLRLQARLYGLRGSVVEQRLQELQSLIDIGEALYKPIGGYSGGMKRRLDLAAALVHNPDILFLDEPTTGLDPVSRTRVWEEVQRLNKELGMTIFLTTQYLEEADQLADRVGIISSGKIVAEGTPRELKQRVGTDLIIVRLKKEIEGVTQKLAKVKGISKAEGHGKEITLSAADSSKAVSNVVVELQKAGAVIDELTLRTPTLDDVFLEVTGNRLRDDENKAEGSES